MRYGTLFEMKKMKYEYEKSGFINFNAAQRTGNIFEEIRRSEEKTRRFSIQDFMHDFGP